MAVSDLRSLFFQRPVLRYPVQAAMEIDRLLGPLLLVAEPIALGLLLVNSSGYRTTLLVAYAVYILAVELLQQAPHFWRCSGMHCV